MDSELKWVLQLRNYDKNEFIILKELQSKAPNFSSENDYNYTKKTNWDCNFKGLSTNFEHLIRKRIGEQANVSKLNHELTLRDSNKIGDPNQVNWVNYKKIKNFENYLPPLKSQSIKNVNKLGSAVSRPLQSIINKIVFFDRNIYQKSVDFDKVNTKIFSGEHNSLQPYNWKYQSSNMNSVRHILDETTNNSSSKWTIGLRDIMNLKKSNDQSNLTQTKKKNPKDGNQRYKSPKKEENNLNNSN